MNKGQFSNAFFIFVFFPNAIIDQVQYLFIGVKDIRLVCLLVFVLLLMSAGALS